MGFTLLEPDAVRKPISERINGYDVKKAANGTHYEAIFKDGRMNGHGIMVSRDGVRFEGEFRDDQPVNQPAKSSKAG